jgi:hypothetical protein
MVCSALSAPHKARERKQQGDHVISVCALPQGKASSRFPAGSLAFPAPAAK